MSDEMKVQGKGLNKKFIFIAIALIAVGLVAALVLLLPTSAKAKKVEEQLNLGAKYLSELDYEQAIAAYEAVIKIDPKCEEAYLALADVYIATGEFEKAEEILNQAEEAIGADVTDAVSEKRKVIENAKKALGNGESIFVPTTESTAKSSVNMLAQAKIGDVVTFGKYMQTQYVEINGAGDAKAERDIIYNQFADDIEWYVLDRKEDKVLLFSKYVLDATQYHNENTDVTWEQSSVREWMNNSFYSLAFNEEEKRYVCDTKLSNPDNAEYGTEGGEDTIDKVFLLSLDEAKEYFNFTYTWSDGDFEEYRNNGLDERLVGIATNCALMKGGGAYPTEKPDTYTANWFLRSMGGNNRQTAMVDYQGKIDAYGFFYDLTDTICGIRPAIWVTVNAEGSTTAKVPEGNIDAPSTEGSGVVPAPSTSGKETPASAFEYEIINGEVKLLAMNDWSMSEVYIPRQIDGYPVTTIGEGAFSGLGLTKLEIPEGVKYIENWAFQSCTSLQSVKIPSSIISMGDGVFAFNPSLKNVEIAQGVKDLGTGTFTECTKITEIELPNSLTYIGTKVFFGCSGLTGIVIPEGVESIGDSAFFFCDNLTSIVIPDSAQSIGSDAFNKCTALTDVVVPDDIEGLSMIFYDTPWGEAQRNASGGYIVTASGVLEWVDQDITNDVFQVPDGVTRIGEYSIGWGNMNAIVIPFSVTSIDNYSIWGSMIRSIEIPASVTSMGEYALEGAGLLTSIITPVGSYAEKWARNHGFGDKLVLK